MSATATSSPSRKQRALSTAEQRIQNWIKKNHGVLSRVAEETKKSVAFVQRIAYNRDAQSKDLVVEHKLVARGCPLIQKIR
jgi:hypothetical protein